MIDLDIWKCYSYMYIDPNLQIPKYKEAFHHYCQQNDTIIFDWKYYIHQHGLYTITCMEEALAHYLQHYHNKKPCVTHPYKTTQEIHNTYFDKEYYARENGLNPMSYSDSITHWKQYGRLQKWKYNSEMNIENVSLQTCSICSLNPCKCCKVC